MPTTGENCQHYWTREPSGRITPYSNTLGWCFNFQAWTYDLDGAGPGTATAPYPRCINLTGTDVLQPLDGKPDNLFFGCIQLPAMLQGAGRGMVKWMHRDEPLLDRLAPP